MNDSMKEYIYLKKQFQAQDKDSSSVLALYEFADWLTVQETPEAKQVLVDVYQELGLYASAYALFSELVDKSDRKQVKKLFTLEKMSLSHGDRFALSRPLTEKEKKPHKEKVSELPTFRYHPDPLATGSFKEGEPKTCPSCGEDHTVYYALRPYCVEELRHLCPTCISTGRAAQKFEAEFIQDADWQGVMNKEKDQILFCQTPGYSSWQGEYWLSCCQDYCAYMGTVGTRELEEMGIAEQVLEEYKARDEFQDVAGYLVKDGSMCGYLFRCLHCEQYHLWVDAD
ncbi:CbrC family protein [Streptococcus australis]|uniref:CbrC family protein n=1 Tax=Streptococcus australis TaxID=113107 RepID=UPI0039C2F66A